MQRPDVVVIGGGIAALSAAACAARLGRRTVVVSDILVGGQIVNVETVANYPGFPVPVGGADLAALVEQQARDAGAEFMFTDAESIINTDAEFTVKAGTTELLTRSLIVATGSALRKLGTESEERLLGKGVSFCGLCDAGFFSGESVAVVGGGDSAVDEALTIVEQVAEVQIITRAPDLHATYASAQRVREHPRIRIRRNMEVVDILGDRQVSGIRARNMTTGIDEEIAVTGVFPFIGLAPRTSLLKGLVQFDSDGFIPTTVWMETEVPGLFVAGDIRRDSPRQLINAASDGVTAAIAADRYLSKIMPN